MKKNVLLVLVLGMGMMISGCADNDFCLEGLPIQIDEFGCEDPLVCNTAIPFWCVIPIIDIDICELFLNRVLDRLPDEIPIDDILNMMGTCEELGAEGTPCVDDDDCINTCVDDSCT